MIVSTQLKQGGFKQKQETIEPHEILFRRDPTSDTTAATPRNDAHTILRHRRALCLLRHRQSGGTHRPISHLRLPEPLDQRAPARLPDDALVQPVMRLLGTPLVDHCPVATAWGAAGRLGGRWARKKIQGWSSS
jgi:hypothetical protein